MKNYKIKIGKRKPKNAALPYFHLGVRSTDYVTKPVKVATKSTTTKQCCRPGRAPNMVAEKIFQSEKFARSIQKFVSVGRKERARKISLNCTHAHPSQHGRMRLNGDYHIFSLMLRALFERLSFLSRLLQKIARARGLLRPNLKAQFDGFHAEKMPKMAREFDFRGENQFLDSV